MIGDLKDAEDLVQETFLRVARRWNRVQSMDHPAGQSNDAADHLASGSDYLRRRLLDRPE
jgi:predicted RNA polymerase sigma factor